ncbi:UMP-CMP kinase 3-like isoform X3 [Silene latifolia]|uniref:UMP-CMP kinase 3-like isoform X3 n=1 Tax=Silene latifolia TaxID=37657 RepID=UPI003D77CF25
MAALLTFSRKIFHHKHIHYHVQFFRTSAAAIDAKQTRLYGFSHLKTPQGFQRFVDDAIVRSGELINYISSMPSSVEVIRAMDEISDTVCSVVDSAELCRNTHPDREFVKQANMASMRMDEYLHVRALEGFSTDAATLMQDKAFSKEVPQFIGFVLGGPGSGKGTQCSKIVETYGFTHLSAGDLLRNEISCSSKNGSMILELIKEGKIVPSEVTVKLIQKAIRSGEKHKYLIDGFPRTEENRLAYERIIGAPPNLVLFFDCPEEEMVKRVLNRNEGRVDDNKEIVKKRLQVFRELSLPVVDYYMKKGILHKINAVGTEDDIFEQVRTIFSVYEPIIT